MFSLFGLTTAIGTRGATMSKVDLGDIPCAGYASQQFDFPALHAQLSQAVRDLLEAMIQSAVTAEAFPDQGRFCSIVIVGHSDRVDTPGTTPEVRRAQEREISELRAESAQAWFFSEMVGRLQAEDHVAPVDLASMRNVEIVTVACGAAVLEHPIPTMEQRSINRRVHFMGTIFTPEP